MDDRPLLSRAAVPAAASALVTLVVQAENFGQRVAPELSAGVTMKVALLFPFIEWRVIVASILIGLVCAYLSSSQPVLSGVVRPGRSSKEGNYDNTGPLRTTPENKRSFAALRMTKVGAIRMTIFFAAIHLLIVFDQTAFSLFGAHMSIGQMDGGVREILTDAPALAGDAIHAGGITFVANVLLVTLCTWIASRGWSSPVARRPSLLAGYAFGALIVAPRVDAHGLEAYPLQSLFSTAEAAMPTSDAHLSQAALDSLRDSTWRDTDSLRAATASAEVRRAYRAPNVVLIVMESVGSEQLLPGGKLSAAVTPRLASFADREIVFPNVYSGYPATTRAHVPLMTGGRTITWGAVDEELTHHLTAPTFVSALRDAGYRTGLFAAPDLRFGSLADFYRTMPWDTVMYYLDGHSPLTKKQEIHSWGVNEDAVRPFAVDWAASSSSRTPFFLEFHTIATHHPYGTWGDDRGPATGTDDHSRYLNSLHYTDAAIGRLLDDLQSRGLLANTIVAITGDHGEAFAEFHANNTLHRNAIWEENIRNFLVLLTPGATTGATFERIASHGDVMPTVLGLAGIAAKDVRGQDLLAPAYRPRIEYFHKDIAPQQTGLRDGRWKYIEHRDGSAPQLFDLTTDPTEQQNLASSHRAQVVRYHQLAAAWYVQTNDDFTARLANWDTTGKRRITHRNLGEMTPPEIEVGHYTRGTGEHFVPTPIMTPNDPVYVLNRWGVLPGDVTVRLAIVSPSHRIYEEEMQIAADWDTSWYHAAALDTGKEPGQWRVSIWRGSTRIARASFVVSDKGEEGRD